MGTYLRKMCLDVNTLLLSLITRMTSVYLMQNKDEVPDMFKRCHKHVKCLLPKFEFYTLRTEMNILQKGCPYEEVIEARTSCSYAQ